MREFTLITLAALGSAVLGGLFGALIGWLSPEFISLLTQPRPVSEPARFGAATGLVAGLFIGTAVMAFGLMIEAARAWVKRLTPRAEGNTDAVTAPERGASDAFRASGASASRWVNAGSPPQEKRTGRRCQSRRSPPRFLERVSMDDALQRYKAFIDSLRPLMERYFKVEDLPVLEGPEGEAAKLLFAKLNPEERALVNLLFRHITSTGVGQTLEYLDQFVDTGQLKLVWQGHELPSEPFGDDLATDWWNRCEGAAWPDESLCPVHKERLQVEPVPIAYGLIRHPLEYYQARKELFPLANAVIEGGCIVGSAKVQSSPYCEGCRKALANWARETGLQAGLPRDCISFFKRYGRPAEAEASADRPPEG
jgi:hypothetical protein